METPIQKPQVDLPAAWRGIRRLMADKEDTAAVFDIMRALSGRSIPNSYDRLLRSREGGLIAFKRRELQPVLDDHAALAELPEGSVGRAYLAFVNGRKISAEGLADESRKGGHDDVDAPHPYAWMARRMRDVHDLWHVLTGYQTDALGEACVVAFSYAQTRSSGFALIAFAAARELQKHLPGRPVKAAVWQAWRDGRKAAWLPAVDYERLLAEPLDEARRRLRIAQPTLYLSVPAGERDGVPANVGGAPAQTGQAAAA